MQSTEKLYKRVVACARVRMRIYILGNRKSLDALKCTHHVQAFKRVYTGYDSKRETPSSDYVNEDAPSALRLPLISTSFVIIYIVFVAIVLSEDIIPTVFFFFV